MSAVRRQLPWAAFALLVVIVGLLAASRGSSAPFDPNGTGPLGAKALVLLLRQYGATVVITDGAPSPDATSALILTDQLDATRQDAVRGWVRAGGRLVVADPTSALQVAVPVRSGNGIGRTDLHLTGQCAVPGTDSVHRLSVGTSLLLRFAGPGATECYDDNGASFLAARDGVVGLGGAALWTNSRLDQDDNAALAIGLLETGGTRGTIAILTPSKVGSGPRSGLGLLGPTTREALVQLLAVFGFLAWWRGRRLGRPIADSQPVAIAGSEIVVAVGDLLARTNSRDAAAALLHNGTRRRIAERLGLTSAATVDQVADTVAARGAAPRERIIDLLINRPVDQDEALVELAQSLAQLRQEVIGGRTT